MNDRTKHKETWEQTHSEEALRDEERSLDIGESGQFAPGGYYNQQGVTKPLRSTLDDIVPPARGSQRDDVD
ncbi:MAG TPA: hypothetical protein VJ023_03670 [Pyrinomonadaceae bacterium]|nr:hypothetical protein [Pyrinomonadaceae bacterium]